MTSNNDFGSIGMALSCTLFLEGALLKYKFDDDALNIIKQWNTVLISLLKDDKYKLMLGPIGNHLLRSISRIKNYIPLCVECGKDISVQSLYYVTRFQENIKFLDSKYNKGVNLNFCDLGCGLSPLAVVAQIKYNLQNVYCIDIVPEIADLYINAAYKLTGKSPIFIDWMGAQKISGEKINMITSLGCLPHMSNKDQKEYLEIINQKFPNFFIEVRHKKTGDTTNQKRALDPKEISNLCPGTEILKTQNSLFLIR